MLAVKAQFDGKQIVLPEEVRGAPVGSVIVIFESDDDSADAAAWLKAQDSSFAKVWDNPGDAIFDSM